MLKFLGNGLTYRPCLRVANFEQEWGKMVVHPHMRERCFFYWNWKADDLDKNLSNFGFGFMLFFLKPGCDTSGWWQWHVIKKKPCSLQPDRLQLCDPLRFCGLTKREKTYHQATRCLKETPLWRYVSHNKFLGNNRSRSSNLTIAIDWK